MKEKDRTLTIKEVAQFLNISNQMVYNLIRDRRIDAFKVGSAIRVLYSDLQSYVERQKAEFHSSNGAFENTDENLFLVQDLNFRREGFQLRDIGFALPRSRILTILGASGSGKTMLLKALAGLNRTESGAIFLGSKRLDTLSSQGRNVGFVFENYALMPHRNGRGNIRFPLEIQKKKREDIDAAVEALAEELNLSGHDLDSVISELPEGIKQMIAIAKADIRNIDILLMDEPMARMDTNVRLKMRVFLKELVAGLGKTTILTLHDPETALALSDYIAILDKGRLIQFGPAMEVYNNPESPIVFEMTSRFAVNRIKTTVSQGIIAPFGFSTDKQDGDYQLLFRADEIRLSEPGQGMEARIRDSHILDGNRIVAQCTSPGGDLELILPAGTEEEIRFTPSQYGLY